MKKIIVTFLLVFSSINAQKSVNSLEQLETSKQNILEKIKILNDSIKKIELNIYKLKSNEYQQNIKDSTIITVAKQNGKLKKIPDVMGEIILTLNEDKKVIIIDYHNEYFGVCFDSICGYINDYWIIDNEKTKEYVKFKKDEEAERIRIKNEQKIIANKNRIKEEEIELKKIENINIKKYGKVLYEKLKRGYYWIGMTDKMALIALGYPSKINRSVGEWGVHEQWVYNNIYLYFENGILKSYQN